ncbi:hypothetical protein EBT25_17845 [bacterium]|jgi:hypothetical protein|nr:hypothetical protein [bacterium]
MRNLQKNYEQAAAARHNKETEYEWLKAMSKGSNWYPLNHNKYRTTIRNLKNRENAAQKKLEKYMIEVVQKYYSRYGIVL